MADRKIKLFISYSHDSDSHKEWVRKLAEDLERDGFDVIFDQEDLRIGMPLTVFMEESLRECDRVLLVITEAYVTRTNNLSGGAAYERMIITAEMVENLGTNRFIPLLRDNTEMPAFLKGRMRVDAGEGTDWVKSYQDLLAELRRPVGGKRTQKGMPESGKVKTIHSEDREPKTTSLVNNGERYHWGHHVHGHVGNKLYLIFVKFVSTGIKFKESILDNIIEARICDYATYELYASHDLLIRAWADEKSFYRLRSNILNNKDVDSRHTELMEASSIRHFPDSGTEIDYKEVKPIIEQLDARKINSIQEGSDDLEKTLITRKLRIADSVRFDKDRLQLYIIVRAFKRDTKSLERLEKRISSYSNIYNKTIYRTTGTASEAVIKAQVDQDCYYDINEFVNAVAEALDNEDVRTETALVACEGPRGDGRINVRAADKYLIDRGYRELIGSEHDLSPTEEAILFAYFAEAMQTASDDRNGILKKMIRLRAQEEADNFDHIRSFFAKLENALQNNLDSVMFKIWGPRFSQEKKQLFSDLKISDINRKRPLLGDLMKLYGRIVEEYGIIELDPLTEGEFRSLMSEAVEIRNTLAHGVPRIEFWDNTFRFFRSFVKVETRLHNYLESIR